VKLPKAMIAYSSNANNDLGNETLKIKMASTKLSLKLLQLQSSQGEFDEKIMTDDSFREKIKKHFLNEKL
jgi:hypothetical protein